MNLPNEPAPKLFISYCWASHSHEQWVLEFATRLCNSGVDVILDKWHLKEGHDAVVFMEQMVSDSEIEKVVIVSNRAYRDKADGREGGVGTETQIISKEVYENQKQDKFVAVIREKDEAGNPYLPIYYGSKIYIDLCEPDTYEENFEKLIRWIFNKPLYRKPGLGAPPSYITETDAIILGTEASYSRVIDAIKNGKSYASGALDEFFETFSANLERFRIDRTDGEFDKQVHKNIEQFIPYRDQAIQTFAALARYAPDEENITKLHRFLESLIPYMFAPQGIQSYYPSDFDNYKFIIHELFLYAVSVLTKYERFDQANYLLRHQYFAADRTGYGSGETRNFAVFLKPVRSLETGVQGELLNKRCNSPLIKPRHIMQSDIILFVRGEIEKTTWWPHTFVNLPWENFVFEVFARAVSLQYFDKIKCLLGIENKQKLADLLESFNNGQRSLPRIGMYQLDGLKELLGYDSLATKP